MRLAALATRGRLAACREAPAEQDLASVLAQCRRSQLDDEGHE